MPVALAVRLVFWLWFAAAIVAGQQQWPQRLPGAATLALMLGLTACPLYAYFRVGALRAWVDALDLRSLALVHVSRIVGLYFLLLFRDGKLPYAFAVPAGLGEVAVAAAVLPLAFAPFGEERRLRLLTIWNVAGLVDLLLIILSAVRIGAENPFQLRALRMLPLSLLPALLVPLIAATHVVLFVRLARARRAA